MLKPKLSRPLSGAGTKCFGNQQSISYTPIPDKLHIRLLTCMLLIPLPRLWIHTVTSWQGPFRYRRHVASC